jgi:hypothetical protein
MDDQSELRGHLIELLNGRSAHIDLEAALNGFPLEHINTRIENSPHTAWELLEHIRLAQWDILDFSVNPEYREMTFPDDYWPKETGTEATWKASAAQVLADLKAMRDLVAEPKTDLFAPIPHGDGQTILREAMLVADHNAYHLGQLMLLRRILEKQ